MQIDRGAALAAMKVRGIPIGIGGLHAESYP
jgi:hypothetical protein